MVTAVQGKSRLRRALFVAVGVVLALALVALLAVWRLGPRYGLYLTPPTPQTYAQRALDLMEDGYYATSGAWSDAKAKATNETRDAVTYADTLPALRDALAVAGGKHSRILDVDEPLSIVDSERPMPAATTSDGITTLVVPKEVSDDNDFKQRYADSLANAISEAGAATSCGWVVDVRDNSGGDMAPMLAGLSPLLPDGRTVGFRSNQGVETWLEINGGTVKLSGSSISSVTDQPKPDQPIAILQGPNNGSSGEVAVLALHGLPKSRSFGQPTAGYSSANQVLYLYDGAQMLLTTAVDLDRTGISTEGGPIEPDVVVPVDEAEEAAIAWLNQECA